MVNEKKSRLEEIYSGLVMVNIIPELHPQSSGKYYRVRCPECGESAYIYKTGVPTIVCNHRNSCGKKTSLWNYLKEKKQMSNSQIFQFLSSNSRI